MSDSPDEDDQRNVDSTSRMWAEPQPGPSRCGPSRQGYCGYCRVLYSSLDQHLSSLRHLDSVRGSTRGSTRGSSSVSSAGSRTKLTLLERFLQDVLQHHPHLYSDSRPSHADLPAVSTPPLPREELDEVRFPDDGSRSPCSQPSNQPSNQQEEDVPCSQSTGGNTDGARLSAPIREQEGGEAPPPYTQAPPPYTQAPPPHRKAHRKTDKRKTSDDSSPGPGPGPGPGPRGPSELRPWSPGPGPGPGLGPQTASELRPWSPGPGLTETYHFSPPSLETPSEDWDAPVQVCFQGEQTLCDTPVQLKQGGRDLSRLMEAQVDQVDQVDQVYSYQLASALHSEQREGGQGGQDAGFWNLPIEEVLPVPRYIPESFRRKSWAQVEQEDELRVQDLVRQFRRGRFVCYFDSESLARYGRRSRNKGAGSDAGALPLLDEDEGASVRKRRSFRVASRCQVVKVSHSTQTVQLVIPAVRQPEAPPTGSPPAYQLAAERTPDAQSWLHLPSSYCDIITPLQPRTSLLYLLCPAPTPGPAPTPDPAPSPVPSSAPKRCRRKRRPLDLRGLKVKYKRLPVRFYELSSKRILSRPPAPPPHMAPPPRLAPPPACVRQLFRSLSPDLNTEGGEGVKGQRFLLSALSRDAQDTPPAPPTQGRGGPRTRSRTQTKPPQTRREGLRPQTHPPPSARRGRSRRGRGYDRR